MRPRQLAAHFSLTALALGLHAQAPVADTQFSVLRGLYQAPFQVVVSSATPGATIRYTLDCSDPRTSTLAAQGATPLSIKRPALYS